MLADIFGVNRNVVLVQVISASRHRGRLRHR